MMLDQGVSRPFGTDRLFTCEGDHAFGTDRPLAVAAQVGV